MIKIERRGKKQKRRKGTLHKSGKGKNKNQRKNKTNENRKMTKMKRSREETGISKKTQGGE